MVEYKKMNSLKLSEQSFFLCSKEKKINSLFRLKIDSS